MRDYELVIVVNPDAGDDGYTAAIERVNRFIQERGGEIVNVDQWGRRRLAYPVENHLEGYYAVTQFRFEPREVRSLEDNLTRAEDVLRHLVTRVDEARVEARVVAAGVQEGGEDGGPE